MMPSRGLILCLTAFVNCVLLCDADVIAIAICEQILHPLYPS